MSVDLFSGADQFYQIESDNLRVGKWRRGLIIALSIYRFLCNFPLFNKLSSLSDLPGVSDSRVHLV